MASGLQYIYVVSNHHNLHSFICFQMETLSYRSMDFEEFCAAAISTYQLEALEGWEQIASNAFEHFEREGNRIISMEELLRVRGACVS